jgi:hypothetical protein
MIWQDLAEVFSIERQNAFRTCDDQQLRLSRVPQDAGSHPQQRG